MRRKMLRIISGTAINRHGEMWLRGQFFQLVGVELDCQTIEWVLLR